MVDATIWRELCIDSQHRTNDEYFYKKLLEIFPSCDKPTNRSCMHGKKRTGQGSALKEQCDW